MVKASGEAYGYREKRTTEVEESAGNVSLASTAGSLL
jgi:hypothetical protein